MSDKDKIEMEVQQGQTPAEPKYKDYMHIRKSQEKLSVPDGVYAKIYKGVTIKHCSIYGYVETQAGATIDWCIINAGELCLFTGSEAKHVLAKEGCKLTVRSGVTLKDFKQTGPIISCFYPGTKVVSPYKKIARTR